MSCMYREKKVRVLFSNPATPTWYAASFFLLVLVSACSRGPVSMPLPSDIDPVELRQRLQEPGLASGKSGAVLTVSPGHVGDCKGWERGASTIRWEVDPAQVQSTRVEVSDATNQTRKVFAGGGSSGEAVANGWVAAGVEFHVVDAASNADLASYTVDALKCVLP